jgi:hypothetical protein
MKMYDAQWSICFMKVCMTYMQTHDRMEPVHEDVMMHCGVYA